MTRETIKRNMLEKKAVLARVKFKTTCLTKSFSLDAY